MRWVVAFALVVSCMRPPPVVEAPYYVVLVKDAGEARPLDIVDAGRTETSVKVTVEQVPDSEETSDDDPFSAGQTP